MPRQHPWKMCSARPQAMWGWLLALVCWFSGPTAAIAFPQTCFIDQARHQPNGAEVVVTGNVIVTSGVFGSANLDQGFAIQDVTGGIYVTSDRQHDVQLGKTVTVTGQLTDDGHGQRMLALKTWHASERPLLPIAPFMTSTAQAGKSLDGQLVTVRGQIVKPLQDDAPYGDRLWIADEIGEIQIYIAKSTGIAPQELPFLAVGRTIQVTGLSSQFDDNDEVMPRSRQDIAACDSRGNCRRIPSA